MSITIKDIARMINVSHTTVSRALNNSPLISESTKKRVREIAEKYNYRPNVNARSLVLARSHNIGLFFSTLRKGTSANFFMDAVRGVNDVIRDNFSLSVEGLDDMKDLTRISPGLFDGIIIMSQSDEDDPVIHEIIKKGIPFVLLNREKGGLKVTNILADDTVGAYRATEWLIRHGHRKIAVIEGKKEFKTTQRRKNGYIKALKDYGLSFDPGITIEGNYDLESGYLGMKKIFELKSRPTAVFCLNDDMAVGAMKAINEKGLNIPGDISVIGFDDSIFAAYLTPSLSSVSRPIEMMGAEGARVLVEKMKGAPDINKTIYLKTELHIRESVRRYK